MVSGTGLFSTGLHRSGTGLGTAGADRGLSLNHANLWKTDPSPCYVMYRHGYVE
jgi:hypothetical protein